MILDRTDALYAANIFTDWTVILQANLCYEKGFDVFLDNPCDYWQRKHVYGEILLYLPFIKRGFVVF
jgi:hypothetical protein